jgi:hypothetical protein
MKVPTFRHVPALLAILVLVNARPAYASSSTFSGNGSTAFNGAVGDGTLTVSDDGSGGVDFSLTLGNGQTNFGGNDFVLYLDNGKGGGISSTATLTDDADGGRSAVSEDSGSGRSTLNFNSVLAPQYAIDIESGYGDIFKLNTPSNLTLVDGAAPGAASANSTGLTYTYAQGTPTVATLDLPAADFGLSSYSGGTLTFFGIQVSESGYSSNELIGSATGSGGWGNTQTVTVANTFTAAVPEASIVGLLACGAGVLLAWNRSRRASPLV